MHSLQRWMGQPCLPWGTCIYWRGGSLGEQKARSEDQAQAGNDSGKADWKDLTLPPRSTAVLSFSIQASLKSVLAIHIREISSDGFSIPSTPSRVVELVRGLGPGKSSLSDGEWGLKASARVAVVLPCLLHIHPIGLLLWQQEGNYKEEARVH